jgi:FSR family fosmidomycin resistance protein-like MFS transporter
MSLFAVGGNLGFAVGPALATPIQIALGLRGTVFLALPALIMAGVLLGARTQGTAAPAPRGLLTSDPAADRWGPFGRLTGAVISRAIVFYGLNTFIPLYWINVFGASKSAGAAALTTMLLAGVAGTVGGGWLADRIGRRIVVLGSMIALVPLLFAFVSVSSSAAALALLLPIGLALYAPFSVMTVMGQEYLPSRIGTASGVTIGLAVTLGGLAAPVLGHFADLHGVHAAVSLIVLVPLLGAAATFTLPREIPRLG